MMSVVFLCLGTLFLAWLVSTWSFRRKLPPGPFSWPIFGCMFSLKQPLHRHFLSLAKKHGPLLYLQVGMARLLVVNSSAMAKEVLKTHDSEFAYRPPSKPFEIFSLGYKDMIFAAPEKEWKLMRKLSVSHIFSPGMLKSTAAFRQSAVKSIVSMIRKDPENVGLRKIIGEFGCDITTHLIFGEDVPDARRLVTLIEKAGNMTLSVNIGELFPPLERFDFHGINRMFERELVPEMTSILKNVMKEFKQKNKGSQGAFGSLLGVKGDDALPEASIMSLMMDMIAAGINTSQTAAEWAMAEVMNNPRVMRKVQEEMDTVLGTKQLLQEDRLPELPYLQAIIKETLRMHPPASLGIPHYNLRRLEVAGYEIPANCKVLINIWAIQRDPAYWKKPHEFIPERFIESDINVVNSQFDMLPFSAGSRTCIGYPLAMRSIPFIVGSLVHAFKWKRLGEASLEEEGFAIPSKMTSMLFAEATPRLENSAYI